MKVKKLLKTLYNTEYVIKTDYGIDLERGYCGIKYDGQTIYDNRQIKSIEVGNYILIITLEERKDNENATNIQ